MDISTLSTLSLLRTAGPDTGHVARLLDSGPPFPPIVVHRPTMLVIDGIHRVLATRAVGHTQIAAVFFDGSETEALLLSVRLNSTRGLPLSQRDRRAATTRLLQAQPDWSDRRVARLAGVSPKTVGTIRRSLDATASRSSVSDPRLNSRRGLDGRVRPLDTKLGRQRAFQLLRERPDTSLREIAVAAGISIGTVSDVHRRMRQGLDPVPANSAYKRAAASAPPGSPTLDGPARPAASRILAALNADPSLRSHQDGRSLLRLMEANLAHLLHHDLLIQAVPAHRRPDVAWLCRRYSESWLVFAERLEESMIDDSGADH